MKIKKNQSVSKQRKHIEQVLGVKLGHIGENVLENTQASESRIRDADMAEVMVDFTKDQILVQSGTAMLAQANMKTRTILQLLGG